LANEKARMEKQMERKEVEKELSTLFERTFRMESELNTFLKSEN